MNIQELIDLLETIKKAHGDCEVFLAETTIYHGASRVVYKEEWKVPGIIDYPNRVELR